MIIAVPYEDGSVFQHFGHTENIKFYEIQDKKVVKSEVVSTNGQGHGALAAFLDGHTTDIVICGGIGGGAIAALEAADIKVFGGVTGSADAAVDALLRGELVYNPGVQCTHHEHEHHEDHDCGSSCGHCGHSCH